MVPRFIYYNNILLSIIWTVPEKISLKLRQDASGYKIGGELVPYIPSSVTPLVVRVVTRGFPKTTRRYVCAHKKRFVR